MVIRQLATKAQVLLGKYPISFLVERDLLWHKQESLPAHPNGLKFTATRRDGSVASQIYYSVGGGFIQTDQEMGQGIGYALEEQSIDNSERK